MKIRPKNFSNRDIEKLRKTSRGIGPRNLVSKNQLLSSTIAGCSTRTDTHARTHAHTQRKQNLETPFSGIYFEIAFLFACASDSHSEPNQNLKKYICRKKGSLSFVFSVCVCVCSRVTARNF